MFTEKSTINEVENYKKFKEFGELLFPVDLNLSKKTTLKQLSTSIPWYSYVSTKRSVSIINELAKRAEEGEKIFYSIYSDEEIKKDARKKYTGLFYFRGNKNSKTAIVSAGGGFQYVGAIHDSFPHCQKLAKKGYNAFALIYRPGAQSASEDLARAVAFLHENEKELELDMKDYSLWGGSAGARMAAWVGTYGTENFREKTYPRPSAVVMQYTGLSEITGNEVATFATVGSSDWIVSYKVMEKRIEKIKKQGKSAICRVYKNLPHGFGLGEGTIAHGWIDEAIEFWENEYKTKMI